MASDQSRRGSASKNKKSKKSKLLGREVKIYECELCEAVVGAEDKATECEICKEWFHTGCVDLTDNEYEVLSTHKIGTIHCSQTVGIVLLFTIAIQREPPLREMSVENVIRQNSQNM